LLGGLVTLCPLVGITRLRGVPVSVPTLKAVDCVFNPL